MHERGTRWEHKIMLEQLDAPTLDRLATEIPRLRRQYPNWARLIQKPDRLDTLS